MRAVAAVDFAVLGSQREGPLEARLGLRARPKRRGEEIRAQRQHEPVVWTKLLRHLKVYPGFADPLQLPEPVAQIDARPVLAGIERHGSLQVCERDAMQRRLFVVRE